MDIVIKTGFQAINHNIVFKKQTVPKAKHLVKIEHVRDVEEYRRDGRSYLIKANVIRQVNVGESPYDLRLNIDGGRVVTNVSCSCAYGQSEKCKHIGALIHFINNDKSLTKTSFQQQWGNPTARQFAKEKYSKGCDFATMYPPPKKPHVEPPPIDISKLKKPSALKKILSVSNRSQAERDEEILRKVRIRQIQRDKEKEICTTLLGMIFGLCDKQAIYKLNVVLEDKLQKFYNDNIVLPSRSAIIELCCDTMEQANSDKWYEARRSRISASKNVHNVKTRKTKTIDPLVEDMLYLKKVETPSTKYGRTQEKNACKQYEILYNVKVQHVGLIICEKQPWLCASPDGCVMEKDCIEKVVEFKCPSTCATLPIVDYAAKRCNVSYLKMTDNNFIELKKSYLYFTQCQAQMYVTGTNVCDLFVYSPVENGSVCAKVNRDNTFLAEVIPKCESFYFQHYLPKLYEKLVVETQKPSQPSSEKEKASKRTFTGLNIANTI